MIVVDTSAWVELLRGTGSPVERRVRRLLEQRTPLAATEVVVAELLAGASPDEETAVRDLVDSVTVLPLVGVEDYEAAAELYRACRRGGETLRWMGDCLIAVPAIKLGAPLLQADRDFEKLARHTPLRLEPV